MVGTPYSHGCVTCRRRHVRCDENKPVCLRCTKGGFACGGYPSRLKWVADVRPATRGTAAFAEHDRTSIIRPEIHRSSSDQASSGRRIDDSQQYTAPEGSLSQLPTSTALQQVYLKHFHSPSALSDLTYVTHLLHGLFVYEPNSPGDGSTAAYGMRQFFQDQIERPSNSVAYVAMQALSFSFFANTHPVAGLRESAAMMQSRSTRLYGQALVQLRDGIESAQTCHNSEVLAAALCLFLCETLVATSSTGFLQHAGGVEKIVELSGPQRFVDFPDHGYFLIARPLIIGQAVMRFQPTFLDKPAWNIIPWSKHPETRTITQRLHDISARMPRIFADANAIRIGTFAGHRNERDFSMDQIRADLRKIVRDFMLWRREWDLANPDPAYEFSPQSGEEIWSVDASGMPFYPRLIAFTSLECGRQYSLWNARLRSCLFLATYLGVSDITSAIAFLSGPPPVQISARTVSRKVLIPPDTMPTLAELGDEYARTIDYFLIMGDTRH